MPIAGEPIRALVPAALQLVGLVLIVGCRSGVERDVVQREMRKQEDQIYALEDYLSEYQQLLCDARAENAALKRQAVKGQFRAGGPTESTDEIDTLPSPPSTLRTAPPDSDAPAAEPSGPTPAVPPLDVGDPGVPPLDTTSADDPDFVAASEIKPASAEIEVIAAPPTAVVLRGEVHLDEQGESAVESNGPRVLLHVEPVDAEGRSVGFHGRLSLLVLDPAARQKERQLARWDFQAEELASLADASILENGFEFPLQLPADSPVDRPLELWVRLIPEDGEKLLGRTTMDVGRPGKFASADVKPKNKSGDKSRHAVEQTGAETSNVAMSVRSQRKFDSNIQQSGWQTARPGEIEPPQSLVVQASTEWKMATRPIPAVESPLARSRRVNAVVPSKSRDDRYEAAVAPQWSPDRSDDPVNDNEPQPRPVWSPTR